jgi:hypothetical protein
MSSALLGPQRWKLCLGFFSHMIVVIFCHLECSGALLSSSCVLGIGPHTSLGKQVLLLLSSKLLSSSHSWTSQFVLFRVVTLMPLSNAGQQKYNVSLMCHLKYSNDHIETRKRNR